MKKSTKKVVNYLRQYVGHEIIRTKQATYEDFSFVRRPILLVGFTSDGCIRCCRTGDDAQIFGNKEFVLSLRFTDRNWITYKKALKAKGNKLNKWRGKSIKRIRPTDVIGNRSFMSDAATLISASNHHMVVECEGLRCVLGSDFVNPEDWELA